MDRCGHLAMLISSTMKTKIGYWTLCGWCRTVASGMVLLCTYVERKLYPLQLNVADACAVRHELGVRCPQAASDFLTISPPLEYSTFSSSFAACMYLFHFLVRWSSFIRQRRRTTRAMTCRSWSRCWQLLWPAGHLLIKP